MNRHVQRVAARHRRERLDRFLAACFTALFLGLCAGAARAQDMGVVVQSCGALPAQYQLGGPRPLVVDINGNLCTTGSVFVVVQSGAAGYVANAVPKTAGSTGTTGAVTAAIPASATQFSYICGFSISTLESATALATAPTVTGLIGGTFTYQVQNVASVATLFTQTFSPCLPSSAVNTAITVTSPANIDATAVDVNVWGFQQ